MKAQQNDFIPLQKIHFPLMHKWLNTPHVSEWWSLDGNHHPSLEEVERHYLPYTDGTEPVDCYIFSNGNKPIGMIQSCKLNDFPAEKAAFGLDGSYAGIDLFIGEEGFVH